jgi:hypothetical protein
LTENDKVIEEATNSNIYRIIHGIKILKNPGTKIKTDALIRTKQIE